MDILNPHHPNYYTSEGTAPPTDNQQLKLMSNFLTVAPGVGFWFAAGWRIKPDADPDKRQCGLALTWLQNGLQKLGAGAKTAAGYGYFISAPVALPPGKPEIKEQPVETIPKVTRRGKVRPQPPKIFITDTESGHTYTANISALRKKGITPKNGTVLEFVLQGDQVVEILN